MTDTQIRKLLAGLTPAPFIWAPDGHVVFIQTHVEDAGADVDEVLAWVEERGGYLDRTLPVTATRRGVTSIPKPVGKKYYVVPEAALAA
ncbi:MAG: hypothetical protein QOG15_3715 [Solirubrobacteraceae bacterium]|jgi:hypothetical protein|nr:hypothetical protein [Solirubrobacteraceae bacterium]